MKYDFETLVDRSHCGSLKWDGVKERKPDAPAGTVPLSVADMEFKNPPEITNGLKRFLDSNILGYSTPTQAYYEAVCGWMADKHNFKVSPEQVVVSPGVVPALYMLVDALCETGDGVIVMPPVYYPFYSAVEENGCNIVRCPLINEDGRYGIDFDLLEKVAAEQDNKMLIFCSPHNPVSRVWEAEELQKVGEICLKHGVKIVSDEIHFDIIMPGYKHTVFSNAGNFGDEVIVCTAPSKTFNLAAMQTSNIIIPKKTDRDKMKAVMQRNSVHTMNLLGYEACRLAYTECDAWLEEMLQVIWGNYNLVKTFLAERLPKAKPSVLEGTYLMWIDCRAISNNKDNLEQKMVDNDLFFDEGHWFGDEGIGFERINLACPKHVLEAALLRLETALKE